MTFTLEDMTPDELQAVKELQQRVSDVKLSMCPDYFAGQLGLLRFIRARKSVDKAEVMFRKFAEWLDEVEYSKALYFTVREAVVENFKWKIPGLDKFGGPVVLVPVGSWNPSKANDITCDELVKLALRSLARINGIALKQFRDKNVAVQATGIADMTGLGMKHVTHVEGIKATLTMVKIFEQNFPEHLRVVFLVNAPYVFSIAWRLVKPLITGNTHEKIRFVYSSNFEQQICEFVEPNQLPQSYGGTLPEDSELVYDGQNFYRVNSNGNNCDGIGDNWDENVHVSSLNLNDNTEEDKDSSLKAKASGSADLINPSPVKS